MIKAFEIFASLNAEELDRFEKFITSAYFNRSKDVIRLFKSIKKFHPQFLDSRLSNENVYKKVYPAKKYNEGTIRNLYSELGALAEKFLGYVNYENHYFFKCSVMYELTDRRFDTKLYQKIHKKFTEENNKSDLFITEKSLFSFFLDDEMITHNIRKNRDMDNPARDYGAEALMIFFLRTYFRKQSGTQSGIYNFNVIPEYNIISDFFSKADIGGLISNMKKNNVVDVNKIEIDYILYLASLNKNNESYNRIVEALALIRSLPKNTPDQEKYNFYVSTLNVLNLHMKSDDVHFKRLAFEVKKEMVEKDLTSEHTGKMKEIEFITIADAAINVQELDWAENFIENKIHTLEDKIQFDLYNFYKAKILFVRGKYDEANEYLAKVNNEGFYLKMDVKTLKMRIYYELDFIDAAFSAAEALRQFLLRTEILSPKRHESFSNFLKFYLSILRRKTDTKSRDVTLLKKELSECKLVRNKIWLTQKLNLFEKFD